MSADNVEVGTASFLAASGGSSPTSPLQQMMVRPLPFVMAQKLLELEHYLHSFPGGIKLAFGALLGKKLLGALTLGGLGHGKGHVVVDGGP